MVVDKVFFPSCHYCSWSIHCRVWTTWNLWADQKDLSWSIHASSTAAISFGKQTDILVVHRLCCMSKLNIYLTIDLRTTCNGNHRWYKIKQEHTYTIHNITIVQRQCTVILHIYLTIGLHKTCNSKYSWIKYDKNIQHNYSKRQCNRVEFSWIQLEAIISKYINRL